jgi:cell migration-inducing and hyaluronan-binding protein
MDKGSWVIFKLPGFATATAGKGQATLDALRKASETSYFRGKDALWVKLVVAKPPLPIVRPTDLQASIGVSRGQAVAAGAETVASVTTAGKS